MIQHNVAQYLITTYGHLPCHHENQEDRTRVAVLVETRDCYFLPLVLKNFCHLLPDWNFHLFLTERVRNFLTEQLPHFQYHWTPIHTQQRIGPEQYSQLLRQKIFWEQIKEETILVFQTDCLLLRSIPYWAEVFDMIGAPCGPNASIYNGGFSIRSKKAMMEMALTSDEANQVEKRPEDVFFTEEMRKSNRYRLPDIQTAYQFATEDVYSTHPVGIHGTDKYYS